MWRNRSSLESLDGLLGLWGRIGDLLKDLGRQVYVEYRLIDRKRWTYSQQSLEVYLLSIFLGGAFYFCPSIPGIEVNRELG